METINKAVRLLSISTIENHQQRELFFSKHNAFINDQEMHFDAFAKRLVESGQHLRQAVQDIKTNTSRFSTLLDEQEHQINRLTKIKISKDTPKIAPALHQHGFHAPDLAVETLNTTMLLAVG